MDYRPDLLRVKLLHPKCTTGSDTALSKAPRHVFEIRFLRFTRKCDGHLVVCGLRGGHLLVKLGCGCARDLQPSSVFAVEMDVAEENGGEVGLELTRKTTKMGARRQTKTSSTDRVIRVTLGGTEQCPNWLIEKLSGSQPIVQHVKGIGFCLEKDEGQRCQLQYCFTTVRDHWDYYPSFPPTFGWLKQFIVRIGLEAAVKERLDQEFNATKNGILSEGEWQCPKCRRKRR